MIDTENLTPTEQRIAAVLADGMTHSMEELKRAVGDEFTEDAAVRMHLCRMREKLIAKGNRIISSRETLFQLVRPVTSGE